jgi:hypothetical protein
VFLGNIFRQSGYTDRQIRRALNPPPRVAEPDIKPDSVTFLLDVCSIFHRISRVLSRHIKSVGLPPRKICNFLQSVKDDLDRRHREYTASSVNAVRSTLVRQAVRLTPG